jgi:shikimate dehydrogenase
MVTGATTLVGILGNPVAHSLSPAMHNAAFQALGMDWMYVPLPVDTEKLGEGIRGICSLAFRGANVTVPHKESAIQFLDEISPQARQIGAVNTITFQGNRIAGDNTDWLGILEDLKGKGLGTSGRKVMILGSGGSARAVAYALLSTDSNLIVCSRNQRTAKALVESLHELFPHREIEYTSLAAAAHVESRIDLVVNTTPLGMSPEIDSSPWPGEERLPRCELVYDLVYNPPITRLMKQAQDQGLNASNGLGMLVHQAAAAFRIWTGIEPPVGLMKTAAEEAYHRIAARCGR